ncbi:hypothetical protein VD17_26720 [Pseudomonas fluorescens]|uniref:Uncharacterized protein n=1 Tax=Pseudomonas fluorescens TaxID=294 RepID=A0A0F4V280_PSEFL|nr:hypothetical protein VD17_26720 [Pseudomonas fluorescens]
MLGDDQKGKLVNLTQFTASALSPKYALFLAVVIVVRQGAATTHSWLWGGAATQHGDNEHRQK